MIVLTVKEQQDGKQMVKTISCWKHRLELKTQDAGGTGIDSTSQKVYRYRPALSIASKMDPADRGMAAFHFLINPQMQRNKRTNTVRVLFAKRSNVS